MLWPEGESLMISGPLGTGKTTLAGLLVQALLLSVPVLVLGLPVNGVGPGCCTWRWTGPHRSPAPCTGSSPRDAAHAGRAAGFWTGPPPDDLATNPTC